MMVCDVRIQSESEFDEKWYCDEDDEFLLNRLDKKKARNRAMIIASGDEGVVDFS